MKHPYDYLGPHRGGCDFCGSSDARHRLADSLLDEYVGGSRLADIANDYGLALTQVDSFLRAWVGWQRWLRAQGDTDG